MNTQQFKWHEYTINYIDEGQGQPLILLHAFPFNALMWTNQIESLSNTFRVIAPDIPSFGKSSPTPTILTMDFGADIIHALLNHTKTQKATISGLSMGGYIALAFAEHYPERLDRLILADTNGSADPPLKKAQRYKSINHLSIQGPDTFFNTFPTFVLGKTTKQKNPDTIKKVKRLIQMASKEVIMSGLQGMAERPARFHVLQKLTIPVCIIVGEEDALTPITDAQKLVKAAHHATLHIIPHAGHMSNIEAPTQFNNIITTCMQS